MTFKTLNLRGLQCCLSSHPAGNHLFRQRRPGLALSIGGGGGGGLPGVHQDINTNQHIICMYKKCKQKHAHPETIKSLVCVCVWGATWISIYLRIHTYNMYACMHVCMYVWILSFVCRVVSGIDIISSHGTPSVQFSQEHVTM